MRVYIGTFGENEANEIADELRKAGIRSELRHSLDATFYGTRYLEGKLKELKEKYKDDEKASDIIGEIEEYWNALQEIYRDGISVEEFENKIFDKILPESKEYEDIKKEMEKTKSVDELIKKFGEERVKNFADYLEKEMNAHAIIIFLLSSNGIKQENSILTGELPHDAYIKMEIKEEIESLPEKRRIVVEKNVDVYANIIDVIYKFEKIEKLIKEKEEFAPLLFIMDAIMHVMDLIENKMDVDKLKKKAKFIEDKEGYIIMEDDAIDEVLKTLEKAEIIRIKKGKIIMKG